MHSLWRDFSYGARGLRREPGFAALAVLTLALGIGAATAMFSVIQNVLLDPFPYNAERVVMFQIRDGADPNADGGRTAYETNEFLDYVEGSTVFEEVIGGSYEETLYATEQGTERLVGAVVTGNAFRFLGVNALYGRILVPEDTKPDAPPVFVLSFRAWQRYFGGDPGALNRTFLLNGAPSTLVGIMPSRFTKQAADTYRPVQLARAGADADRRYFMLQGRLKRGVTLAQAQAEATLLAQRLAKVYPRNYPEKFNLRVVVWIDNVVRGFKQKLYLLAAAVALLLLIACVNVANLLLARAASRGKEMAVRMALGAGRGRLIRQLLAESLLLALLGAVAGSGFAWLGLKLIVATIPEEAIPREAVIQLNVPALLFSLGAAACTSLLFGLMPAWQTVRRDLVEPLKDSGKGGGASGRGNVLRSVLVVFEVTLSLVLLFCAGLMMRTLAQLQTVELGFRSDHVLSCRLPFARGQNTTAAEKQRYFRALLPRLQTLPGVVAVATATSLPPFGGATSDVTVPGQTTAERRNALVEFCSEDYLGVLRCRMVRGRFFTAAEVDAARPLAVINQTLAARFFAGEDPLGRTLRIERLAQADGRTEAPSFEIIGVMPDMKNNGVESPPIPACAVPFSVTGGMTRNVLVRTASDPLGLVQTLRREIWAQDRSVAVTNLDTLDNFLGNYVYAEPRFTLIVLGIFSVTGLVLVALGVYSVIAYSVTRRTQEIGIRMALGASRSDVLRLVLIGGARLIGAGLACGLGFGLLAARLLANQLWQVSAYDPLTLGGVAVLVTVVGLAACLFPARRATRVDPLVALRYE